MIYGSHRKTSVYKCILNNDRQQARIKCSSCSKKETYIMVFVLVCNVWQKQIWVYWVLNLTVMINNIQCHCSFWNRFHRSQSKEIWFNSLVFHKLDSEMTNEEFNTLIWICMVTGLLKHFTIQSTRQWNCENANIFVCVARYIIKMSCDEILKSRQWLHPLQKQ